MTVKDMLTKDEIARNEAKNKDADKEKDLQPA